MIRRRTTKGRGWTRSYGAVGVAVLLVMGVALFISYRANSGLPFQPRYDVYADVPDATRIVHHNDVRIGGVRVGQVASVSAMRRAETGETFARLKLSLDESAEPLPSDTRIRIRLASLLGRSYVELEPGSSSRTIPDGGRISPDRAARSAELQDLFDVFDRETARATRQVVGELAYGFAGRGADFNEMLASLRQLLPPTERVMRTLALPETRLPRYLRGFTTTMDALEPVREDLAALLGDGAETFGAVNAAGPRLGETLEAFPPAETATTRALARLEPALQRVAGVSRELLPGAEQLPEALPALNGALRAGVPALQGLPRLTRPLRTTFMALDRLSRDPATDGAVRRLTDTVERVDELLTGSPAALTPAQVQCNIFGLYFRNVNSFGLTNGTAWTPLTALGIDTSGAENESFQHSTPSPDLHINPSPNLNYDECEAGNEPYTPDGQQLGNPPGLQSNEVPGTSPPPDAIAHTPPGTP